MDATYWVSALRESGIGILRFRFAILNPWWVGVQIKASELWIWNPGSERVRSPISKTLDSDGFRIHNAEHNSGQLRNQKIWIRLVGDPDLDAEFWIYMGELESQAGIEFLNSESGPPEAGSLLRACLETLAQISRNR